MNSDGISTAARDLELFLSGRGRGAEGSYSPAVLKGVGPFAVFLHRRVAMASSVLVPAAERVVSPSPHVLLLPRLCQRAAAVDEHALAELLDWAEIAWSGRTSQRYFYARRALPEPVYQHLHELVTRHGAVMRRATGSLALRARADHLRAEKDRLAGVDRTFTRPLFVKPVEAVLHDLSRGVVDDHGLLEHPPETLVARANAAHRGHGNLAPVPSSGKRWPVLVKNTAEICELLRGLLEIAAEHTWEGPDVSMPPLDRLDPGLAPVVEALLFTSADLDEPRADGEGSWVARVAAEALMLAAAEHRHLIALSARGAGVPDEVTAPALEPLERIREQADTLFRGLARDPDGEGEDLHSLILDALVRGDLPDARQGLDMLEELAGRTAVEARAAAMRQALAGLQDRKAAEAVGLHLRTVELHLEGGDLRAAESYIVQAEQAMPVDPESAPTRQPQDAEPTAAPMKPEQHTPTPQTEPGGTVHDDELPARILAAARTPTQQTADRAQLERDIQQLGRSGPLSDVVGIARDLLHLAPDLVLELTDLTLLRARPALRPSLWQLQYDALRGLGHTERAESVFLQGHPPLPPESLPVGEAVPGADLLTPYLRPFHGPDGTAEPSGGAGAGPRTPDEEARLHARSLEEGNTAALGYAIGWAVHAGRAADALDLYRRFGPYQYINAAAAWNIAAAYAAVGCAPQSLQALDVFQNILSRMEPVQRRAMTEFMALHQVRPAAEPAGAPGAPTGLTHPEEEAKRLHAVGRAKEAAARLEHLLSTNPRSPGAFLLLRIHREGNDLAGARSVVDRIEAAGAATWRHHLELARNAVDAGDLALAGERLERAQQMGATAYWTEKLLQQLRAQQRDRSEIRPTPVPVTGTAPPPASTNDIEAWRKFFATQLRTQGLHDVLEATTWTSLREPVIVGVLTSQLRILGIPVPRTEITERLIGLVNQCRDSFLSRDLAMWLINGGDPRTAVRVLQDCVAWTPPERLPRVVFLRDQAVRKGGLPEAGYDPPSPPTQVTGARRAVVDPAIVPEVHVQEIGGPAAADPLIHDAQQLPSNTDPSVIADAWLRAARDGHSVALGNALATLVRASRAEEAIAFYHSVSDRYWLGGAAAWNLGCAYTTSGHVEEAVTTFQYHARVSTWSYSDEQRRALTALFASVGRPVPTPAGNKPLPVRGGDARPDTGEQAVAGLGDAADSAEGEAARRIAQCSGAPTSHHFYSAGTAVRRAMQSGPPGNVARYLATMRNLFALVTDPNANAVAEMAAVLETAGRAEEAWDLLLQWIDRTRAESALLAPAVRISRELGHDGELRRLLERHHRNNSRYEIHLSLAKLAQRQNDEEALLKYADLALQRNRRSVEAAVLRESAASRRAPLPGDDRGVLAKVKNPAMRENPAIQQLMHEYADEVRTLRLKALTWFQPKIDRADLERRLSTSLRTRAAPAFRAAAEEDWETATRLFKELLEQHPRNIALSRATVACQLKCGMVDDAAAVAEALGHLPDGVRLQVQVACDRGDYAEAGRLLELFLTLHDGSPEEAIAQAGLLTHLVANRAPVAPRLLLEFARRRRPGTSDLPLALAVVLADRQRKRDLAREAVRELRRPHGMEPDALVTQAIEYDAPHILNDTAAPPLGVGHLERMVEHLRTDTPRLLCFLKDHLGLTATSLDSPVVREAREYCATLLAEHGLVRDAYAIWHELVENAPTTEEKGRALDKLRSFCEQISFAEGYRYALVTLPEVGIDPSDEDLAHVDDLSSETEPQALPEETKELVQAVVARRSGPLAQALTAAVDQLKADAGPQDAVALERLRGLWTGLAERLEDPETASRLAGRTTRGLVESATRVESELHMQHRLAKNLISTAHSEAAVQLSDALHAAWDEVARHHLKSGGVQRRLDLTVHRATRLGTGPVEIKVEVTSFRQPLRPVTVRVDTKTFMVGDLEPHSSATRRYVLTQDAQEVTVTASGVIDRPDRPAEKTLTAPVTGYPHDQRLAARFNPSDPVDPDLFVGRTKELEDLTHHYEKAARTNTRALFMTGSRQAGKTSIAYQLSKVRPPGAAELPPPGKWRIPRVFPVYLNAEMTADGDGHLMTDIAKAVALAVDQALDGQAPDVGMPEGSGSLDFLRWWRDVRQRLWQERVGLLLILDEFQHLLCRLKESGSLESALSDLRGLKNGGDLALLFCGAATTEGIRELLEGTRFQQEFTTPYVIGPLDMEATLQAFHQGFLPPVDVMPDAAARVWDRTKGHPQHIHMLGSAVLELLREEQRTIVDSDLVEKAFHRVVADDDAVISLLDPYGVGHREQALELLHKIAGLIDEGASDAAVKAQLGTEFKDLEALRAFGILVKAQDEWQWINEIVRTWLDKRRPQNSERTQSGWQADEEALRSAGYLVVSREDGDGPKTCLVQHPSHPEPLVARHHPGHRSTLARLNEILHDPTSNVPGVPDLLSCCGDWVLFRAVEGVSLRRKLDARLAGSVEISPVDAARWIADACVTLHGMLDARHITHGNLRPENLVLVGEDPGELHVLDWGYGADLVPDKPLLPAGPVSGYAPPEARGGTSRVASPQDDVFALSAILYQLLHPSGALPYADEESFRSGPPPLPGYGSLNSTVWQAVSKRPDARFPSALELRKALEEAVPELRRADGKAAEASGGSPSAALPGTTQTELRGKLDQLTEVIEFLTDSLTGDEENDVERDRSQLTEAVRADAPDPRRVTRFARRLRETLANLGTPSSAISPAIRMVDEILDVTGS
ncbi:hypothetical protein ACFYNL_14570 [Streptomyces sp. NPDC007808]|uniref:hypothetical protein n=1 Tax=Streptomyces sp. NPDC007808 TaxID=3364779 RepID=UPI00369E7285